MPNSRFPHRKNRDGLYQSICAVCFVTVGSRKTERELEALEKAHTCDQSLLNQRKAFHEAWKDHRLN